MADFSVSSINLAAVKQFDPFAKEILDRASQVALYTFNGDKNEWKKTEVEGALFVYSRNAEPYHNILIMNRLNTFNLVEPVVQGLDIQEHAPFLLYRNNKLDIFGIWFYEKNECERIARVLDSLVKEWDKKKNDKPHIKRDSDKHAPPKVINICANNNNNSVDICSMLSRAQEEYNSGKVPVSSQGANDSVPTATPQSVMDFFAKASSSSNLNKEKVPMPMPTAQLAQPPGLFVGKHPGQRVPAPEPTESPLKPIMQRLMSNPVHSVEHIEKQQRSVTPQQNDLPLTPDRAVLKEKQRNVGPPILDRPDSTHKPELMPPVMFTSSTSNVMTTPKSLSKGVPNPVNIVQALSESLPEIQARPVTQLPLTKPEPLTKNQLLQAFSYLLKNDPDFINVLHAAYVKSFAEIVP